MPIKAKDFLEFAEWAHDPTRCDKEIGYRCSISRAYYAAFHVAKEHLQMPDDADHEEVIEKLKDYDSEYGDDELSGRLLDLKKKRKNADYRLAHNIKREMARKSLDKSKKFIEEVVKLKVL
jgi:uncharacterized protein (UPF0332 family)